MTALSHPVRCRAVATFLVVFATIAVLVTGPMVPSHPARAQESSREPVVTEALCPATAESWDVLFLMDESQSLRENDPNRERIDATKRYISDLEQIAGFGPGTRIRVALAAFGSEFDLRMEFTDLREEGTVEEMYGVVDGFGADDLNTDYVLALFGALDDDLDWSAACNRVVWLTDGQHDLSDAYKGDQSPRPYDGQERRINTRGVARAIEELLIPAVCGVADGTADEVAAGYGDLRSRVEELGVEIEDHLYYVGTLVPGDTQTLIDRMETDDCGRPMNLHPLPDWIPPPVCGGLPEPQIPAGRDVVWSGDLPDGVAPAFVRSVIVQATGDSPELTTDHPLHSLEGDGSVRRLTLDFSEEPWSGYAPEGITVRGEHVEDACVAAALEPPLLEASIATDPIFPDTQIVLVVSVNGRLLSAVDERFLEVLLDGERLGIVKIDQGSVRLPEQDVGDHAFEVRLVSDHADAAIASGAFTVSPKPAICEGLPEPNWSAGKDIVWSGALPEGIAPAFVRSVVVRATGDRPPTLSSDHPFKTPGEDGDYRLLTLDFSSERLSSYSPEDVAVHGEGVVESCLAIVLEPPPIEARVLTSPIFPDTRSIELQVFIDGGPIAGIDTMFMTLLIDGETVSASADEAAGEGRFGLPVPATPGDHTFEVRIESRNADPATDSGAFTVSVKPDGPILRLATASLDPVEGTEFTIPITIDDDRRPGMIRILQTEPIVGTDGKMVKVEVGFSPDGRSVWNSGDPVPATLTVVLGDSVQTPENHVMHFEYESDPSEQGGDIQTIPLSVKVDIDILRNPVLEAIIVGVLLALLLVIIWAWLFGINRIAGRIRRPRGVRYSRFLVDEGLTLASEPSNEGHRPPRYSHSMLEAGRLRARRKTPLRVWRFPFVELSMARSRRFVGVVGEGYETIEISERSTDLPESRLRHPVVLVDMSNGPPFEGVVMAPIDPSRPTEEQLTDLVRRALERLPRPDRQSTDRE